MRDTVLNAIAKAAGVEKSTLTDSTDLVKDLGLDSLSVVELTLELQDETGIEIPDAKLEGLKTIGDLLKVLDELSAK